MEIWFFILSDKLPLFRFSPLERCMSIIESLSLVRVGMKFIDIDATRADFENAFGTTRIISSKLTIELKIPKMRIMSINRSDIISPNIIASSVIGPEIKRGDIEIPKTEILNGISNNTVFPKWTKNTFTIKGTIERAMPNFIILNHSILRRIEMIIPDIRIMLR